MPDIEQYGEDRSFYTPPETWAFPLAKDNEQLKQVILNYDETKAKEKILRHHDLLGNKETGKATQYVVEQFVI